MRPDTSPMRCEANAGRTPAAEAFAESDKVIDALKDSLEELVARLMPVSNTEEPVKVPQDASTPVQQRCHSPLVDKIYTSTDKIALLNMQVQGLISRLEV